MSHDVVVIGGGPGGYSAAIRAAQLGLSVALVEKDKALGGTCLHRGCIPSKAYLAAADMVEMAHRAAKVGIEFQSPKIDFEKLFLSKEEKVKGLAKGIQELIKAHKITFISGEATLDDATHVRVGNEVLETRFVVLAVGTEPVRPALFPFNGESVFTTDELFLLKKLPKRLLIVGGGVIGCEMACAFQILGSEVTLVELLPNILPLEDRLPVKTVQGTLEKRGTKFLNGVSVTGVTQSGGGWKAALSDGNAVETDAVLVAVGRSVSKKRLESMGINKLGVKITAKGFIEVSPFLETSVEGIYAIGDVTGKTLLAHGAMAEGLCAVGHIAGDARAMNYDAVPSVIYTIPELASIGKREEFLKKENVPYRVGRFSYQANAKALCHEEREGLVQIFISTEGAQKDQVLGASVVGSHAADLIQEVAIVMTNHLPIDALIHTIHSHPTLGEMILEAAEDTHGMAIHKMGRRS